jgi:2-amino-4-hydroxy-6-hydroxymethyldihydropteridine diphosphokinase
MAIAYIGLGSNLSGNHNGQLFSPQAQLEQAVLSLRAHHRIDVLKQSSFYQTAAIGPGQQPDYINAVVQLQTSLKPIELLDLLQSIENQQGRERTIRWGARTLDLDILLYDQHTENSQRLILPHPRMHERSFVLAPLAELAPQVTLADGKNIAELLANCSMQGIVKL